MKKQLQGIGLILFGLLLCAASLALKAQGFYYPLPDFLPPAGLAGLCFGVAGLVFLFGRGEGE